MMSQTLIPRRPPDMSPLRVILALVSIVVFVPRHLPAQTAGAVISGTVRSEAGVPLASAVVASGGRMTTTDSLGHFELTGLSGDSARVHVRRVGSPSVDTAIALRPGKRGQLDVRLESYDWDRERRKAECFTPS